MGGPHRDPDYWKRWRAAHPAYQARERARSASRDRTAEYAQRKLARAAAPHPGRQGRERELLPMAWATDHPLVLQAWTYVQRRPHGVAVSFLEDELALDCVGEAALAILEGRDPVEAVRACRARETNWQHHVAPMPLEN